MQAVQREGLGVGARSSVRAACLDVVAVHVPLDERDVVIAKQRVEVGLDECERVGVAEVEHQLLTAEHRFVPFAGQRPVGVRTEDVAVGVDHLGLDPDPELHAEAR